MNFQELFSKISEFFTQFITFFDTEAGGIIGQLSDFFANIFGSFGA